MIDSVGKKIMDEISRNVSRAIVIIRRPEPYIKRDMLA